MPKYERRPRGTPAPAEPQPQTSLIPPADTPPDQSAAMRSLASEMDTLRSPGGAQPPMKRSKLAVAMDTVSEHMRQMDALTVTIDEVEKNYPKAHVFDVATKEGYRLADKVRKDARESRLHVATMRKQGTDLLNGLKTELWALADPQMARLQAIEDNAKAQVAAQDQKDEDRKKRHVDAIAAIGQQALGASLLDSQTLVERVKSVNAIIVDDSYEEFQTQALQKKLEVVQVLEQALNAAKAREAKEEADRQEKGRQDVAAAKQKAARERIAYYKSLPTQLQGAHIENVRANMRTIGSAPDDSEEKYGDMAEFVDMARVKAVSELNLLLQGMEEAQRAVDAEDLRTQQEPLTVIGYPEVAAPTPAPQRPAAPSTMGSGPVRGWEGTEDPFSTEAMQAKARANVPSMALPTVTATTHTVPAGRIGDQSVPRRFAPRLAPRPVAAPPAPTPAPTAAPPADMFADPAFPAAFDAMPGGEVSVVEGEVPDLLKAAQDFITAFEEGGVLSYLPDTVHVYAFPAFKALKDAVDFHTEFS